MYVYSLTNLSFHSLSIFFVAIIDKARVRVYAYVRSLCHVRIRLHMCSAVDVDACAPECVNIRRFTESPFF